MKSLRYIVFALAGLWLFAAQAFTGLAFTGSAYAADIQAEVETVRPGHPFWVMIGLDKSADGAEREISAELPDGFHLRDVRWPLVDNDPDDESVKDFVLAEIIPPKKLAVGAEFEFAFLTNGQRLVVGLEVGDGHRSDDMKAQFTEARSELPIPSPWPVWVKLDGKVLVLSLMLEDVSGEVASADFVPDRPDVINPAYPPTVEVHDSGKLRITAYRLKGAPYIKEITGTLVLHDAEGARIGAYLIDGWNAITPPRDPLLAIDADAGDGGGRTSFGMALLFALIGGVILNLMPCVFPVLSIKLFGLVKAGTHSAQRMRADGLAYTAGILASFMIVVITLLALRDLGQQIGWGFQLQSPGFILALVLLMFAVTLNLLGVFEVPGISLSRSPSAGETDDNGVGAAFSTGMLTTVMATPCTAPFMAPALGYALAQPLAMAMAVFLALGLGLALPYLLVSHVPSLHDRLPKPGIWMVRLRQALAVPMLVTVGWLVWVLSAQLGAESYVLAAVGVAVVLALALVLPRLTGAPRLLRAAAGAMVLALFGLWVAPQIDVPASSEGRLIAVDEVAFSRDALAAYRRRGQPVFLDFTAAWCITCLVHDRLVLGTPEFRGFLKENGITLMVADWTNPNAEIAAMLESFGRAGIPFYVFYPADPAAKPVPLPEIFTTGTAIEIMSEHM